MAKQQANDSRMERLLEKNDRQGILKLLQKGKIEG